jgi:hypothetical protein
VLHLQTITDLLAETRISADSLAVLSGLSPARISQGIRGIREFSNDETIRLLDALKDVKQLIGVLKPIPVDLSRPLLVRQLIAEMKLYSDLPTIGDLILLNSLLQDTPFQQIMDSREWTANDLKQAIEEMQKKFEQAQLRLNAIVSGSFQNSGM